MEDAASEPQIDWTGFIKRIHVNRSREDLWCALATAAGICSWFTHVTEFHDESGYPLPGDRFAEVGFTVHWEWTEGTGEDVRVLGVSPGESVRFSWYDGEGWVEFRAREHAGRSFVEIEQRMESSDLAFLQDVYVGCSEGWVFFLANLKSVLEGGHDLREFRPDVTGLVNV